MAHFNYSGRDRSGKKIIGTLDASDPSTAARKLEAQGILPISIHEISESPSAANKPKKKVQFDWKIQRNPRMKINDLLLFSRELSDLVASGMTIGKALHSLAGREDTSGTGKIVTTLRDEIIQGTSFSKALEQFPETFSPLYINLVRAGEASGHLPGALEQVCTHYERVQEARGKVLSAMSYPLIVLCVGGLAVIGLMVFIVPKFASTFEEMGATLPRPTLILMAISNFLLHDGLVLLLLLAGTGFIFRRWKATEAGKFHWHRMLLRTPLAGKIISASAYAHFSRTLGTLLGNGVSMLQALGIVQKTIGNVVLANEVGTVRERVTDGSSLSGPLARSGIFPRLLVDMLAVGEETGDLPAALSHITRRYEKELDRLVQTSTTVLEPLLIVFVALIIGGIAVALLLPVLTLTDSLHI